MKNKKVLITGALGMLGRVLVREYMLTHPSEEIILVDTLPQATFEKFTRTLPTLGASFCYLQVDILDEKAMKEAIIGCDLIFHLAGIISYDKKLVERMKEVNVRGAQILVQLAQEEGVQRIVYASSISAIALQSGAVSTEKDFPKDDATYLTNYSQSKIEAERVFLELKAPDVDRVAANLGVILGNNMQLKKIVQGIKNFPIFPLLPTFNSYIDVQDAAQALMFLAEKGKKDERYIVTAYNVTNEQFIHEIALVIGKRLIPLIFPKKMLEMAHSLLVELDRYLSTDVWRSMAEDKRFSTTKINNLGWSPKYSFTQAAVRLVNSTE